MNNPAVFIDFSELKNLLDGLGFEPDTPTETIQTPTTLPLPNSPLNSMLNFPKTTRVIFNLKTSKSSAKRDAAGNLVLDPATNKPIRETINIHPVLTTTVYFDDGTKTVVKNSVHDNLTLTPEGEATPESKEVGYVYALVKRLMGKVTENGTVEGNGLARKLREVVDNAWDVQAEAKKQAAAKKLKENEQLDAAANAKPKKKRYSIAETLERMNTVIDSLHDVLNDKDLELE